jgi:hypothetical protein
LTPRHEAKPEPAPSRWAKDAKVRLALPIEACFRDARNVFEAKERFPRFRSA